MKNRAITRGRNRLALAVLGSFALLLLLAFAAGLVAPRFVDLPALQRRIAAQVSDRSGGKLSLRNLRLSFLPAPHVVAEDVRLSIPNAIEGTFETVSVYPGLLALLRGKVQLARLQVAGLDLRVQLPQRRGTTGATAVAGSAAGFKDMLASAVASVAAVAESEAPGLVVAVRNGQVKLSAGDGQECLFTDVHARVRLPPQTLSVDVTCASNLWEHMSLDATLDPTSLKGSGHIAVSRLRPRLLSAHLFPASTLQLGDSEVTLRMDAVAEGLNVLHVEVDAAVPALTVHRGAASTVMKEARLAAALRIDQSAVEVTVSDLQLHYPQLQLSGRLAVDHAAPQASVTLEAKNVDVASVREVAGILAGDSATSQAIFDVLRGGRVPQVAWNAHGGRLADLGDLDTMVIRGRLVDGRIHVPPGLVLADVTGEATIANGILVGQHAAGRLGNARASAGIVRVGLLGEAPPIHVEAKVQADAAELPGLLKRLVASDTLSGVLQRVSDVQGTAAGELVLDGSAQALTATADVSAFKVSGRLQGFGFPLQIAGGRFLYDARGIAATNLTVAAGGSTVSQLSMRLGWAGTPASLEVTAGESRIVLEEVYPWLTASDWLRDAASRPTALRGTVGVKTLQMKGPAETPAEWQFNVLGAADHLEVESPWLREWIVLRHPVSLSALRLARDATTGTSLSASFAAPDDLKGSIDFVWYAGEVAIKKLDIHDKQSDASLSLRLKGREFDLTFAGSLNRSTVDALVAKNPFLGGWVHGDFRARILLDQPTRSTAEGRLEATDVFLPAIGDVPLSVKSVSLDASVTDASVTDAGVTGTSAGKVSVDAAIEAGENRNLRVRGTVRPSPQAFIADLDLTADHLEWNHLKGLLPPSAGSGDGGQTGRTSSWDLPLRGTLRLATESFTYAGYTWRPLRATVDLTAGAPSVTVTEANLCGIDTPGKIATTPQGLILSFRTVARNQQLHPTLTCLTNEKGSTTGHYDLAGNVTGRGKPEEIGKALRGHVEFTARAGRIENIGKAAMLFSVVSVATGSLAGFTDLGKEGLAYDTVSVKGDLADGTFMLKEAVLDGPTVKVVGEGSVNLLQETVNVTLLVAPLKTVDSVVSRIPFVGDFLGGSLVSIPVKVSGDLIKPTVTPLAPSVVGERLLGMMTSTLKLPMRVIQPLIPGK